MAMFTINVTIEKGTDLFSAWAENIPGIYGEGESVKEVKEDILKAIQNSEILRNHRKIRLIEMNAMRYDSLTKATKHMSK